MIARGFLGSLHGKLTGRKPPVTREVAHVMETDMYYDPARAISELELSATPLDTIVEDACRWFTDHCR